MMDIDRVKAVLETVIGEFGNWDRDTGELKGEQPSGLYPAVMLMNEIDDMERLTPQPEWVDGLPPAGTVCECYHTDLSGKKQWVGCDVVGPYGDYVICAPNGGGFYGFDADELRPIPTPEQRQREDLSSLIEGFCISARSAEPVPSQLADAILSRYNLEPKST